jgi:two-component system nitrogen regulation sensor histidine kinase NtrY
MPRLTIDQHILLLTLGAGGPAVVVALALLWTGDYTPKVQWTLSVLVMLALLGFAAAIRTRVVVPLQTLANLLAALREDDFSIRGRTVNPDDPFGAALAEVNALAETLHHQRLGAVEATALLRTVMEQIDVAVFAFDPTQHLRIANRTGERLMNRTVEQMLGRTAEELGVTDWFGESPRVVDIGEAGGARGRWEVRRTTFRLGGLPHDLLVLSDVSRPLREQERQAWQRLIRVIGHELGNSLGPIKSIAGSLETLLQREPPPSDWRDDMQRGLQVIASRTESLSRFTGAYARLARLPAPRPTPIVLKPFLQRLAGLETRVPIQVRPGRDNRRGPRSARAALHQPAAQRDRRQSRNRRRCHHARLAPAQGHGRHLGRRRGAGAVEYGKPVRALLHDQARRVGHRAGALPPDRGSARGLHQAGESRRQARVSRGTHPSGVMPLGGRLPRTDPLLGMLGRHCYSVNGASEHRRCLETAASRVPPVPNRVSGACLPTETARRLSSRAPAVHSAA